MTKINFNKNLDFILQWLYMYITSYNKHKQREAQNL